MKNNVGTHIWGPSLWRVLHTMAFHCGGDDERAEFLVFLGCLKTLIPCEDCREHYAAYVRMNDPEEASNLAVWTVMLHNAVNVRLKKPTISFEEAAHMYDNQSMHCDARCARENKEVEKMDYGMLFLLIFVACASLFVMLKNKK